MTAPTSRRDFLKTGAVASAALVIPFVLPVSRRALWAAEPLAPADGQVTAWVRIGADESVTIMVGQAEMGQGVLTSMPMLVAEELDVDWTKVKAEIAPADKTKYGDQFTGGSTSIRRQGRSARQAGAAARAMLVSAAAAEWGVDAGQCTTERGVVVHRASGKSRPYGALVARAAALPVPADPPLKDPKDYHIVGTRVARLDTPLKVNGTARYGMDVRVPGMLVAIVARCKVCGGKVKSYSDAKAKAMPGVRHIVRIDSGVAVVADSFWRAKRARDALEIVWDEGTAPRLSSADISKALIDRAAQAGATIKQTGDATAPPAAATIEGTYEVPFLAHAPMEPQNCTAHVQAGRCDVWAPTQVATAAKATAMRITGLPESAVMLQPTFLGGGFGRRLDVDYVADAVQVSKAIGLPVKVIWTREDDMQNSSYRPASYHKFSATLDADGWPTMWSARVVTAGGRPDPSGLGNDFDYNVANRFVDGHSLETPVPTGAWRSVGHSNSGFAIECFADEVAHAGKKDPVDFRRRMAASPRLKGVVELAAEKAGWGAPIATGRARGIAAHSCFGSYVAQVVEISLDADKSIRVHRVVCAVDCGRVVNPDTVEAQLQSAVVFGLTATLKGEITLDAGRIAQSNFHDYRMLRMNEMPKVEVYIVPSTETSGGIGEPGVPPIAAAVANAVFALTGQRVRKLPIRLA